MRPPLGCLPSHQPLLLQAQPLPLLALLTPLGLLKLLLLLHWRQVHQWEAK